MGTGPEVLLKMGGSLCRRDVLRPLLAEISQLAEKHRLLILPGGGPFTDQVREADREFGLGEEASHWMAILGMEQYGYLLAHLLEGAVYSQPEDLDHWREGRTGVFLPYRYLWERDPVPHTWEVTSDSIALYLAAELKIRLLVLLKSVDGITGLDCKEPLPRVTGAELGGTSCVDGYFGRALPPRVTVWIVNGGVPGRLTELLQNGTATGTRIIR